MTPEQRAKLEEIKTKYAEAIHPAATWPCEELRRAFMAGAQAAWKMRDEEIHILNQALSFMKDCHSQELSEAIKTERDRCTEIIRFIRSNYAEDIFTPVRRGEPDPISRDRVSAQMARHLCDLLVKKITESEAK